MDRSDVAIVIPAYNEEKTIHHVVSQVFKYGKVIVVNDASTDNTKKEAEKAGAIVVSHERNYGYDGALNTGLKTAYEERCGYVITIDADGQHSPNLIETYLDYLLNQNITLVLGIRPKKARFSEMLMGIYFRMRFNVHDILCGMKGYNMRLYEENKGFDHIGSIGTELAFFALKHGYEFVEIEVPIKSRVGNSRFGNRLKSNLKIIRAFIEIIKLDLKNDFILTKQKIIHDK